MRRTWTLLATILLAAPGAFAGWSVKGAFEPDTVIDAVTQWGHTNPDQKANAGRFVYLNGFSAQGLPVRTTLNPNSGLLTSSIPSTPYFPVALMGIWKDCNADGYVGLGDNGLLEYRAEILTDRSICPVVPPPSGAPWLAHNDGHWVVEYVPIGYDDVTTPHDENPLNLNDTSARVWADWGLPGDMPQGSCALHPAPYGTYRSTGGFLRYADCFTQYRGTRAVNDVAAATGTNSLSFADAPADRPDQSRSTLNRPNPWGHESDEALVETFDCSRPIPVVVSDPTDQDHSGDGALRTIAVIPLGDERFYVNGTDAEGYVIRNAINTPAPQIHEHGSPAGTVNETQAGLADCDRSDTDEVVDLDGRRGGSDGDLPYALEGSNDPVSAYARRSRTDYAFTFEEGGRGSSLASVVTGERTRDDYGAGTAAITGFWVATAASVAGYNPHLSRHDLGAERVPYITFYGSISPHFVGAFGLRLPAGSSTGIYGTEGCSRTPATFECEPTKWWRNSIGQDTVPRDARLGVDPRDPTAPGLTPATEIGVRVGQPYQLRDVDCIDTSAKPLRESGVHWGALTQTACARPS